jgi:hypothetical protein
MRPIGSNMIVRRISMPIRTEGLRKVLLMRSVVKSTANPSQKLIKLFRTLSQPQPLAMNHDAGEGPQAVICKRIDSVSV